MMFLNNQFSRYNANSSGIFNFSIVLCGAPNNANFIGGDVTTSQEGVPNNYALVSGNNNIGNITACGTSSQEFANYSVNGAPFSIIPPSGTINQEPDSVFINSVIITGYSVNAGYLNFSFSKLNIGPGSVQNLTAFTSQQTGQTTIPAPIPVNITEYGNIGQFISGNFSGTVTGTAPPNNNYTVIFNFRVRRNY
jgi:hypothetical protein